MAATRQRHPVPRQAGPARAPEVELRPPTFVGRERELATLTRALGQPPALVLIEGEAGIGKTRLMHECLATPWLRDRRQLLTTCPPLPEPLPFGPIVDALRGRAPRFAGLRLSPLAGALRPLFPEWAADLPPAPEPPEDPGETRHRLFAAVGELLNRLGIEILVVEDAQWADAATLEFLLVLSSWRTRTVSLVATYRPEHTPVGSLLRRLTSRSQTGALPTRVELAPLTRGEAGQLVASMLAAAQVSDEFAALLHERTDGIPLALEETVMLLADRRDLIRRHGGEWSRRAIARLQVPPTVRDAVLERASRLETGSRQLLDAAAVLVESADESLLGSVAELDDPATRKGLADTLGCGLLHEAGAGRFEFRHVLASQAVYEAIPVSERRRLHRLAARALQAVDLPPVAQLARHFREANDVAQWSRYAEAAADVAMESGSDQSAVLLLHELVAVAGTPGERARLARKLAEAALFGRSALGDLAGEITQTLRQVLADERLAPPNRGEVRVLLGLLLLALGMDEDAAAYAEFEAAVPDLDHDPALAARAMLNLGWPWTHDWPAAQHRQWLERASGLLPRIESPAERLSFRITHATALLMLGEEAGWEAAAQIPTTGATQRERQDIVRGMLNVAQCEIEWGRYAAARQRLATAVELAQQTGYQRVADVVRISHAYLDWYTGAWDGLAETATELAGSGETDPSARLDARLIQARLELARGARGAAERWLRALVAELNQGDRAEAPLPAAATLARLCLADGSADEALRLTEPDIDTIQRKGVWLWATDIAPVRVEALVAAGRVDEAEALVAELAGWLRGRSAPAPQAALATCRAILAGAGDQGAAAELAAEAAAAWAALPRPYDELRALERRGRCLLATGREEAVAVLTDAEHRLAALGARWDANRVAHLLRRHGADLKRGWRGGQRGYGERLSPRELEVVRLVATGLTNRQAAEALYLSPHTVTQHLQSAMRKLGVHSRTAVAIAAADAGLLTDNHQPVNAS